MLYILPEPVLNYLIRSGFAGEMFQLFLFFIKTGR